MYFRAGTRVIMADIFSAILVNGGVLGSSICFDGERTVPGVVDRIASVERGTRRWHVYHLWSPIAALLLTFVSEGVANIKQLCRSAHVDCGGDDRRSPVLPERACLCLTNYLGAKGQEALPQPGRDYNGALVARNDRTNGTELAYVIIDVKNFPSC
ncbi:hypothetical protein [Bradyrhizobium sp. UFLA05-112]